MENNILKTLTEVLEKDERFISNEGDLLKNTIREKAENLDENLISLLLDNETLREKFFIKIKDVIVFDNNKFIKFINNKEFLPDSYTSFKNKIGLTSEKGDFIASSNEVVLSFPFKDCVLAGGQDKEDVKRDEVFYNEILGQDDIDRLLDKKVFTNFKRIDKDGEHKLEGFNRDENGIISDNLIIKGNNLLALHSLRNKYLGKVKLIYIDPPYNTGGDNNTFTYNNRFNHSTWLTFMKNRLEVAKELLLNDGFICIAIDHYELMYLGVLADEIFGRENRLGIVSVIHKPGGRNQEKFFASSNEFMLVYAKNKEVANFNKVALDEDIKKRFIYSDENGKYDLINFIRDHIDNLREKKPNQWYPIYVNEKSLELSLEKNNNFIELWPISNSGREMTWKTSKETFLEDYKKGEIIAINENGKIQIYRKFREQQIIKTHWDSKTYNSTHYGTLLLEKIIGRKGVSFPKSLFLIQDIIKLMTSKNDIIIDFHSGSGTTGNAVLNLNKEDGGNRKFILIEQLQEHIDVCIERNQKVCFNNNQGSFVFMELMMENSKYIEEINNAKNINNLLEIYNKIKDSEFINYKINLGNLIIEKLEEKDFENFKLFLIEILDKNLLYKNYSEQNDKNSEINEKDKILNNNFYNNDNFKG